ncbi:MAG TPA: MarR family winged helix-turn-helix transcriptional regulator [Chryseolinea sp.]
MASKKDYVNTGAYLRTLYDALVTNLHARLAEEGYGEISPSHGLVFQYMNENGSRATELAFQAGMTKQSMSALVYQLEEYGYLKRKDDPQDARAVLFVFTAKGETLKRKAQQINYQFEKKWEEKLGAAEYQNFRSTMQQLVDSNE